MWETDGYPVAIRANNTTRAFFEGWKASGS